MYLKIFVIVLLSGFLCSCFNKPEADFTWSPVNPKVGETVQFENHSENAWSYSWNLGDMNISSEENPAHAYEMSGNFIVDLRAHRGLASDEKTVTVSVTQ